MSPTSMDSVDAITIPSLNWDEIFEDLKSMEHLESTVPLTRQTWFQVTTCCVYSAIAVVGLVGNSIFLMIVYRCRALHTITNWLLMHLAIANLLFIAFHTPVFITRYVFQQPWTFGLYLCKVCSCIEHITAAACFYLMAFIAFDRWLAVFHSSRRFQTNTVMILTVFVWAFALAAAAPYWLTFDLVSTTLVGSSRLRCELTCDDDCKLLLLMLSVCVEFMLPMLVIAPCYAHLMWFLCQRHRNSSIAETTRARENKRRTIGTLMGLLACITVCWTPLYVTAVLHQRIGFVSMTMSVWIAVHLCASLAVTATPAFYLTNGAFREELARLLACTRSNTQRSTSATTLDNNNVNNINNDNNVLMLRSTKGIERNGTAGGAEMMNTTSSICNEATTMIDNGQVIKLKE